MLLLKLSWVCSWHEAASGSEKCSRGTNAGGGQEEDVLAFARHFWVNADDVYGRKLVPIDVQEVVVSKHVAHGGPRDSVVTTKSVPSI